MVIMTDYCQRSSAQATILWDCAFSEADRVPFMVPEQVAWSTMFKTLNSKFTAEVQTQHNLDQHDQQCLAEKIFNKPDCADDFSNMMVSWAQFNEGVLPGQWFTFWKWFEGVIELTKTHLKTYWSEGLIFGFIGKQKLHQILRDSPAGTFLLHFSHSWIGGIIITYVSGTEKGEPEIQSIPTFTKSDLQSRNLGDRIRDISHITHLYPDIPKDQVFKRFYSEPQMLHYPYQMPLGYISDPPYHRISRPSGPVMDSDDDISDTEDKRPVGSHSTETLIPLKKYSDAAIPDDLPRSMDPYSQSSSSSQRQKGNSRGYRSRRKKKYEEASSYFSRSHIFVASPFDLNDDMLDQPRPVTGTETGMINQSPAVDVTAGFSQDETREMDLHETAGPSTLQLFTSDHNYSHSADFYDRKMEWDELSISASSTDSESFSFCGFLLNRKYKDDCHPVLNTGYTDAYEWSSAASESASGAESDAMMEMETTCTALKYLMSNTQPTHCGLQDPGWSERDSSCLSRSHSVPSLSQTSSAENKTFPRSQSLTDMLIKSSSEEFTPDIPVCGVPTESDTSEDSITIPPPFLERDLGEHVVRQGTSYADLWPGLGSIRISYDPSSHSTAGPSRFQHSSSNDDDSDAEFYVKRARMDWMSRHEDNTSVSRAAFGIHEGYVPTTPSQAQDQNLLVPIRKDTDDGGPSFEDSSSTFSRHFCPQSTAPTVCGPPCPQDRPVVLQDSAVCTEGSRAQDDDVLMDMETSDTALKHSVTNNQPTHPHLQLSSSDPGWSERDSSCLSRSHSIPSLSQTTSAEKKTFPRSQSSPDMLKSSCEEFTPDISVDKDDETYRFQCSCPGLYQCSVTGLLFHMEGEGDVLYRTIPWNRRLLTQHHKRPAGPLFDIKCVQQSVCQLHLPHCEILSTGGGGFLSVAHVTDEDIQFIVPHKITETHVVINITGFSAFGNVEDEDSPPDPVRALVLLFYRPPADPDLPSFLKVLLLPRNVVIRDVVRTRKNLDRNEIYIDTVSKCDLHPKQKYTLSTCPEDKSVRVQPKKAEFDSDNYDNYITSFQVRLNTILKIIDLILRDTNTSSTVWEGEVCPLSIAVRWSCRQGTSSETLLDIRSDLINGISGPVLNSLLDELLKKKVITDSESGSANAIQVKTNKARSVIDTVRAKGEAASSEMIEILCELDSFLCEHLGLI